MCWTSLVKLWEFKMLAKYSLRATSNLNIYIYYDRYLLWPVNGSGIYKPYFIFKHFTKLKPSIKLCIWQSNQKISSTPFSTLCKATDQLEVKQERPKQQLFLTRKRQHVGSAGLREEGEISWKSGFVGCLCGVGCDRRYSVLYLCCPYRCVITKFSSCILSNSSVAVYCQRVQ
jgi:hypothetical protein